MQFSKDFPRNLIAFIEKLSAFKFVESIYLFGSRARGDGQPRSDVDIAVVCPTATQVDWNEILKCVEEAPTLLKIDCVRFDSLDAENPLRKAIMRDKVILYQK